MTELKYNTKFFNENKVIISENGYCEAYDLDGYRIGISQCDRSRYVSVFVDGETVATRAKKSNAICLALEYLNKGVKKNDRADKKTYNDSSGGTQGP